MQRERETCPAKVRAVVNGLTRIITFSPGYVCTATGPNSHGRHGMEMLFVLKGPEGAVQFMLYTGWMPDWGFASMDTHSPLPAGLGYHSHAPQYDGQMRRDDCAWLDGRPCYYDGSGLNTIEAFKVFVNKGEEALWALLEDYYRSTFGEENARTVSQDSVQAQEAR